MRESRAVFISFLAIVSIVLITIFANQVKREANLTGNSIRTIPTCIDDDPLNDRFLKGNLKFKGDPTTEVFPDKCASQKWLVQSYCTRPSRMDSAKFLCLNGCKDGVCLR